MRGTALGHDAVFISYARKDGIDNVRWLEREIRRAGFATWHDTSDIDISSDFTAEIELAIRGCRAMVLCVSPDVVRLDSFVRREIAFARLVNRPIVVARFADVTPPISVVTNTFVDFHVSRVDALARLLRFLREDDDGDHSSTGVSPERDYLESLYREIIDILDEAVLMPLTGRRGRLMEVTGSVVQFTGRARDGVVSERFRKAALPVMNATVRQAFDHSRGRLGIVGEAGSGKTISMLALARDLATTALTEPGAPLPVLVSAATWGAEGRTESGLTDWIGREVPLLHTQIDQLFRSGRVVLLVDGLDEAPTAYGRTEQRGGSVRDELVRCLARVQLLVIAGRPGAFESAHQELGVPSMLELQPLDDKQIADFVHDLPAAATVLRNDDSMRETARTPLMLTMLCSAIDIATGNDLGRLTPTEARDLIVVAFVETRFARESAGSRVGLDELRRSLGALAMSDVGGGGNRNLFSQDTARTMLGADGLHLVEQMSILVPTGRIAPVPPRRAPGPLRVRRGSAYRRRSGRRHPGRCGVGPLADPRHPRVRRPAPNARRSLPVRARKCSRCPRSIGRPAGTARVERAPQRRHARGQHVRVLDPRCRGVGHPRNR
ncbi:MAG: TIR domain-containing protein [Actinomycetota bacterium]|nr:TIR domain-containing protein [Actinomycetota bacterium]